MQLPLFNLEPAPPAPAIWERVASPLGQMFTVHIHTPSGWEVHHCCHPTANFPYYILTAQKTRLLAPNGRGFQNLALAKAHIERMWSNQPAEPSGEDLREYDIIRCPHGVGAAHTTVETVTGFRAADRRRNELQGIEHNQHPTRTSWTMTLYTLQLNTTHCFDLKEPGPNETDSHHPCPRRARRPGRTGARHHQHPLT